MRRIAEGALAGLAVLAMSLAVILLLTPVHHGKVACGTALRPTAVKPTGPVDPITLGDQTFDVNRIAADIGTVGCEDPISSRRHQAAIVFGLGVVFAGAAFLSSRLARSNDKLAPA